MTEIERYFYVVHCVHEGCETSAPCTTEKIAKKLTNTYKSRYTNKAKVFIIKKLFIFDTSKGYYTEAQNE